MTTEETRITLDDFIQEHKITMTTKKTFHNPYMDNSDHMNHWIVTLKREDRTLKSYYSQGLGIKTLPTAKDVLDCLASDAAGYDNSRDFADWASEYGYDEDSRKAEKTYHVCAEEAKKLRHFLGEEAYQTLLWNMERQ